MRPYFYFIPYIRCDDENLLEKVSTDYFRVDGV